MRKPKPWSENPKALVNPSGILWILDQILSEPH